jgi:hypothetical protein
MQTYLTTRRARAAPGSRLALVFGAREGSAFLTRFFNSMPRALQRLVSTGVILTAAGCGHTPSRLGVLVDNPLVTKAPLTPVSDATAPTGYLTGSSNRVKLADLFGDDELERLEELPDGAGIDIRSASGSLLKTVRTTAYLTDFGAVAAGGGAGSGKEQLVLYTYPNKDKGGTFSVRNEALEEVATWNESPPPGRFAAGHWHRQPAVFYLQEDALVVRSPDGTALEKIVVPEGRLFRDVFVQAGGDERMVLVVSGSGYTPYHMVCVYDGTRLIYQEVGRGLVRTVDPIGAEPGFIVASTEGRSKYTIR